MRMVMAMVLVAAFVLLAGGQTSFAEESNCFTDLANCYEEAAAIDSFWYRWAAGLDCELNVIECVRIKLIGY